MKIIPCGTLDLCYLFKATLADGSVVRQTPKDVCPTDPRRTAFWDLCVKGPDGDGIVGPDGWLLARPDILTFEIKGQGQWFLVDLRDGHFEAKPMDQKHLIRIDAVDSKPLLKPSALPLELVYFRRRRQHFNTGGGLQTQECEYHFGWKDPKGVSQTLILV